MSAKIISQKRVFEGFRKFDVVELEPRSLQHDGYATRWEWEVLRANPVAKILVYCPGTDEILLNQQFRIGPYLAEEEDPFLLECPGGIMDSGETPEDAARRESLEETGCDIEEIEYIGRYFASPGCTDEKFYLYIGKTESFSSGIHGQHESGEEIKTHIFPASDIKNLLAENKILEVMSALMLQYFVVHHDRLRKQWS